ncbi:MAG: acetate--CoA ligase family protein [Candidatus Rokubacteria bacterium]|nr:acetate--CoA ligase family protein [Candidatus Rokubacteria bacterium]
MTSLAPLFRPRSAAVLGVSRNPAKLGHRLLKNVLDYGFEGKVFPVNPSGELILGLPTVAKVADLPPDIDLALVSLPGPEVLTAVKGLAGRRVKVAVILSSGFGEVDAEGRQLQAELRAAAAGSGMRLVGPNCMGVYSHPGRLNGTYFWDLPRTAGGISVISQSGAYGGLIIRHLGSLGLGLSKFLSIGNQVDLEIADLLDDLAGDPETTLIAAFIESVRDGKRFVEAARRATERKPLVVLKGGRTEAGGRAAGSHTGALAGTFEVYKAAFRAAGAVAYVETEEFFDAIQCLAAHGGRGPKGRGVAIVTVSGGPSVIAADTAEAVGLSVPALPLSVRQLVGKLLPSFAALGNPVDLTPQVDPARIAQAAGVVLGQGEIAGAVAINVGLDLPEFADGLIEASRSAGKPIVACAVDVPAVAEKFNAAGVPVYPTPERAVRAYRALLGSGMRYCVTATPRGASRIAPSLRRALETGRGPLPYDTARKVLTLYGVPFCREGRAASLAEALRIAKRLAYPVVVKAERTGLLHKTEAAAVRVDVRTPGELRAVYRDMTRRLGPGPFLIQQQVRGGVELLIGGKRDPTFGPVVVCGTGGILTEALGDVSLRLAPLGPDGAREMLKEGLKGRLLRGLRGMPPCDPRPLVRILVAVSRLMTDHPSIVELDLNPVIASGPKALAVDALLILGP